MSVFSNPTIKSTIERFNGDSFGDLHGFGMYSSPNATYYYLTQWIDGKVYIFNDEWKCITFKRFNYPFYMISIDNNLYMTGLENVWKVDKDLNILRNYNPGGWQGFEGISYNPSNGLIYVAATQKIFVFNFNLKLIRLISTEPHMPSSIAISSNKLYVGTSEGIILIYQNEEIINQFNGCDGKYGSITSILFDSNGYMATSCGYPTLKLYLFSPNGSYTGKSITTPDCPQYIGFDSKGQFIQISGKQISISKFVDTDVSGNKCVVQ